MALGVALVVHGEVVSWRHRRVRAGRERDQVAGGVAARVAQLIGRVGLLVAWQAEHASLLLAIASLTAWRTPAS